MTSYLTSMDTISLSRTVLEIKPVKILKAEQNGGFWPFKGQGQVSIFYIIEKAPSHLTLTSTSYLGRLPSHCMRSEYFVRTVSLGKPFGTSHAQPHCPKCYMHHPHGGDMLIWATGSDCKILYLNYRGWGFYQTIPPHSKKCVVPRMTSYLDQCLLMNTMYWHNSFPRSKKLLIILSYLLIETGENSKQNLSTDKIITKFYKFFI